jgi:hypothetical protein
MDDAVDRLLHDRAAAERLAMNARRHIERHFLGDRHLLQYAELLAEADRGRVDADRRGRLSAHPGRHSEAEADRHACLLSVVQMEHSHRALGVDDREVTDSVRPREATGSGDR